MRFRPPPNQMKLSETTKSLGDEVSISDIAEVHLGGTPKTSEKEFWGGGIPWATARDVASCMGRYLEKTEKTITEKGLQNSPAKILPKNTIIITSRGTVGKICLLPFPMSFNQTCYGLVAKNNVDPMYFFYRMRSLLSKIGELTYGTVFDTITKRTFSELKFHLPSIVEQRAVAGILSSLDEKIELNNRANKTLETISQILFKHWFVDFEFPNKEGKPYKSSGGEMMDSDLGMIPKGWAIEQLGEYVDAIKGVSYRSEDLKESDKALVSLKSIERGGGFRPEGLKPYVGEYRQEQVISPGEVVVAHTDLTQKAEVLGKPAIVRKVLSYPTLVASLDLSIVRPKNDYTNKPFIYFLLKTEDFQNHAYGYADGTTVLHLSRMAVPQYKFVFPQRELVKKFGGLVERLLDKTQENDLESEVLTSVRDALLPRLMSGEIRIHVPEKEHGATA